MQKGKNGSYYYFLVVVVVGLSLAVKEGDRNA